MSPLLADLGLGLPVIAAPMAGGPTTPALVAAAHQAGALGFLAAGYKTADALAADIAAVRSAATVFGVNVFAPNPVPADPDAYQRYAAAIQPDADRYGVHLPDEQIEDDDHWRDKIDILLDDPVAVVSFTFGVPSREVVRSLQRVGTVVVQTVTSAAEARTAVESGPDALAVQASAAGGHSGTLTPHVVPPATAIVDLVASVCAAVTMPLLAAGGLSTADEVAAVIVAGAEAVMVGTILLLTDESGASAPHRSALSGGDRDTAVTRAFTGRPARGLRNEFIERYDSIAIEGYPAVHHLTSPLRKAAAAAGDPELVNLWAGTGYRQARAEPAAQTLQRLAGHG